MAVPVARDWLLDRKIVPDDVGLELVDDTREFLERLEPAPARRVPHRRPGDRRHHRRVRRRPLRARRVLPRRARVRHAPAAEHPLHARHHLLAVRRRHPQPALLPGAARRDAAHEGRLPVPPGFVGSTVWWGDPEQHWGRSTIEGGDVMPVGNGTVLVGMSERTSRQGITQLAAALFAQGAAERVVVAGMPRLRAAMHLDTVFTFADRDVVTLYPKIVDAIHSFTLRPADGGRVHLTDEGSARFVDVVAGALGLPGLRVDRDRRRRLRVRAPAVGQRQQRGRRRAGRRVHLRPQHDHQRPAAGRGHRGAGDPRGGAGPRARRWALHDLPDQPRPPSAERMQKAPRAQ